MKKIIAIMLVLALACVGFVACNEPEKPEITTPAETTPEETPDATTPEEGDVTTKPEEGEVTTETTTTAEVTTEETTPEETYPDNLPTVEDEIKDDVANDDFPPAN